MEFYGKVHITINILHSNPLLNLFHSFDNDSNKEINTMIFQNVQAVSKDYDISLIKRMIQLK